MRLAIALILTGMAQPALAQEGSYSCTLETDVITHRIADEWQVTTGGELRNNYDYRTFTLTFDGNDQVSSTLDERAMGLPTTSATSLLDGGIIGWSAPVASYCGVLDATCQASAAFYATGSAIASLVLSSPAVVRRQGQMALGTLQLLYSCEKTA